MGATSELSGGKASFHAAAPPILIRDVIEKRESVVELLERNAPYRPLGGWFRPVTEGPVVPTSPMWFQQDWVHANLQVAGSELFLHNPKILDAAREYYHADFVEPHTIYVNLMPALDRHGPAHTDNPYFRGVDRTNAPMMFLRAMFWSGLFERWALDLATSIWWLDDVVGGGLRYWPDGPDADPKVYVNEMANTALVGDNHAMFHQVEPVLGRAAPLVTPGAELGPDGSGSWSVHDQGAEVLRAPLEEIRVSVLWKGYVYESEAARDELWRDTLDVPAAVAICNRDLAERGIDLELDVATLEAPETLAALREAYPEPVPRGAGKSIFEY